MIRLIGAESGLTIAMMRLAATMLPKPILMSRVSMATALLGRSRREPRLLDVLDLLAQALELALDRDHAPGDLPPHLLQDDLQRAADGATGGERRLELRDVAPKARELLGDVATVGKQGDLGRQAPGIHRRRAGQLRHAPAQPGVIVLDDLRGARLDRRDVAGQPL